MSKDEQLGVRGGNDSVVLLIFSLIADLAVFRGKREVMALSVQAIAGAIIASVMFAIGVSTWLHDRRGDEAPDATPRVSPPVDKRPAVRM